MQHRVLHRIGKSKWRLLELCSWTDLLSGPPRARNLVNAFAGVPDVVTLHAGLPSTDSFPLLTICASSLPHSQQACQVPTAAASVPESAQPTGATTTDCA
ncbi:hypothetical protein HaLaN_20122, partial [Haematococcus lacustris]